MQGRTKRLVCAAFACVALTGVSSGGCSDGVPTGHKGDKFDEDDIRATVVDCASRKDPAATVRISANTSPKDRTYFVGVEFLDSEGNVVDSSELKLTPQPDSEKTEEITENVEFPMNEPEKAGEVDSCEMDHAF